jgi:hypothetical protein
MTVEQTYKIQCNKKKRENRRKNCQLLTKTIMRAKLYWINTITNMKINLINTKKNLRQDCYNHQGHLEAKNILFRI